MCTITLQMYFYLFVFAEQKEDRKTLTHIYDGSHQRQNQTVFECVLQTPNITPETTEAKMEGFNLSSVCCLLSQVLNIKS